tara:strand:+ start:553 stop:786 length:234 start_codon:yes stop_codon:yes gene_type:complete
MSGHPRWPGFNSKTGDPARDNAARNLNRKMYRLARRKLRFIAAGRKRKKALTRIEGGHYITLWASVYNAVAAEHNRR